MPRETSSYKKNITASLDLGNKRPLSPSDPVNYAYDQLYAGLRRLKSYFVSPAKPPPPKRKAWHKNRDFEEVHALLADIQKRAIALKRKKSKIDKLEKELRAKEPKESLTSEMEQERLDILAQLDELFIAQVNIVPDLIKEHAIKRVDLFFYLLVAVYKQGFIIEKGETVLQHGKGSQATGTAGCHASLFPHVVAKEQASEAATPYLQQLFAKSKPIVQAKAQTFLEGTHFENALNLTHQLPEIVNQFDCFLEGKYGHSVAIQRSLEILNKASVGEVNPVKGLDMFCKMMQSFYSTEQGYNKALLDNPEYKKSAGILYPKSFELVRKIQREGTLTVINQDGSVDKNYVAMLMGLRNLSGTDVIRATMNAFTGDFSHAWVDGGALEKRIFMLQQEILAVPDTPASALQKLIDITKSAMSNTWGLKGYHEKQAKLRHLEGLAASSIGDTAELQSIFWQLAHISFEPRDNYLPSFFSKAQYGETSMAQSLVKVLSENIVLQDIIFGKKMGSESRLKAEILKQLKSDKSPAKTQAPA